MSNNPEFPMSGITFVIATPSGDRQALPFKLGDVELQHAFHSKYTVVEVVRELRALADNIERTALEQVRGLKSPSQT